MSHIFDMASGQKFSGTSSTRKESTLLPTRATDLHQELALRLLSVAESEEPQTVPPRPRPWIRTP